MEIPVQIWYIFNGVSQNLYRETAMSKPLDPAVKQVNAAKKALDSIVARLAKAKETVNELTALKTEASLALKTAKAAAK